LTWRVTAGGLVTFFVIRELMLRPMP
jgi:hypothetical protein